MWRNISNLMKRYYEDDKKYISYVFRNNDIKCEMNVVGIYSNKKKTFMIVVYPLNEDKYIMKSFGPTIIKLLTDDKKVADNIIDFIKSNINETPPNFNKIYSEFSDYIVGDDDLNR